MPMMRRRGRGTCGRAKSVEQALIVRWPSATLRLIRTEVTPIWNDDYADGMREVYRAHQDDHDVAALFAEAIMNRTPWQLWDIETGKPAEGADTREAIAVSKRPWRAGRHAHPGLLHMYIHLMEMSPLPERALRAADTLRDLVPDAGHLNIWRLTSTCFAAIYKNVVDGNGQAIAADRKYLAREGANNFYSLYRCHDFHFKLYGAMFLGQLQPASKQPTNDRNPAGGVATYRISSHGGLAGGLRADEVACAYPLRALDRHHRHASARGPGAVLRHNCDDPLCQGGRSCGDW